MATHWEHSLSLSLSPSVQHLNKILAIFRSTCELHWLHGSDRTLQNKNTSHKGHKCGRLHAPAAVHIASFCFSVDKRRRVLARAHALCWNLSDLLSGLSCHFVEGERSPGHKRSRGSSCSLNLADPPFLLSGLKNEQNMNPVEVQWLKITSSWVFSGSDPGMKA